jgi:hypothetical protein
MVTQIKINLSLQARSSHAVGGLRTLTPKKHTPQHVDISQRSLFTIEQADLGDGATLFEWSPRGNLIAVAGSKVCAVCVRRRRRARVVDGARYAHTL